MRKKVVLACEHCGSRNYTTMKKADAAERFAIKKYCKTCNEQVIHRETR